MCTKDGLPLGEWVRLATEGSAALAVGAGGAGVSVGSRRRRIWELEGHAHCPVIGVGLPITALRKLADKVLGGQALANDYELHCGVIGACQSRTPMAEAVNKELDRRYALPVQQASRLKSEEALTGWWAQASQHQLPGALWATLTHARCSEALAKEVLGQVHMIQHQVGAACRVDMARFEALMAENAVLARSLAAVQSRHSALVGEQAQRIDQQQAVMVQLRADLIGRDTALAAVREELQALESSVPGLKTRTELTRQCERHIERIHHLERALLAATQEAERQKARADHLVQDALVGALSKVPLTQGDEAANEPVPALGDRAVLCVGGRRAIVPIYRELIERAGGRFLHHDGGEQESVSRLDATLAAADLVICQTGCISHDAYWRVKDHCKRTGKRCVFVENPSASSLVHGLERATAMSAEDAQHRP
jgi:Uncharacterized protein conserved in bacteria (DUF2325)